MVRSDSCGGVDEGAVLMMDNDSKLLDVEECDDELDIVDSGDGDDLSPLQNGGVHWLSHGSTVSPHQNSLGPTAHLHINAVRNGGFTQASSVSPTGNPGDPDRRIRRQIANCNERRRMQSINAGFQSLRALLPRKEGEKLSKAAILQQTAELIQSMQQGERRHDDRGGQQWKKRRVDDSCEQDSMDSHTRGIIEKLQSAYERERNLRMIYESQLHQMRQMHVGQPTLPSTVPSGPLSSHEELSPPEVKCEVTVPTTLVYSPNRVTAPPTELSLMVTPSVTEASVSVIRPTPAPQGLESLPSSILPPSRLASSAPSLTTSPVTSSSAATPTVGGPLSSFTQVHQSLAAAAMVAASTAMTPPQLGTPPLNAAGGAVATHRSLNVILDAIRHLEGGAFSSPSTPPSTPTSHANLMVR